MTEKTGNKNSPVRLPDELRRELRRVAFERGQESGKEPSFGDLLLEAWSNAKATTGTPNPSTTAVSELPGPLAGLDDHQIWTIHNLIEILKTQPQGAIFRSLDFTLDLAINEYRKTKSAHKPAITNAPREGSRHVPKSKEKAG